MKRFPEKRIVITGAGSGLGRALALEFARMQWRIAIAEINDIRAEETAELVTNAGGEPLVIHCDVTRPADLDRTMNAVIKKWGGIDILVNNAGVAAAGIFEKIPLETWEWILAINLKGIIYGCRTVIPLFKQQGYGYIVNVASGAGLASLPEMSCYNVSKAGAVSASETLRVELAGTGIGVSVVCPTFFKTRLMDQFTSPDERQRQLAETFFSKSASTAEAIAKHIVASIRKNRFYVVTQRDGRILWYLKRHFPELYFRVFGFVYGRGIFDKYLGLLLRILNFGSKIEGE